MRTTILSLVICGLITISCSNGGGNGINDTAPDPVDTADPTDTVVPADTPGEDTTEPPVDVPEDSTLPPADTTDPPEDTPVADVPEAPSTGPLVLDEDGLLTEDLVLSTAAGRRLRVKAGSVLQAGDMAAGFTPLSGNVVLTVTDDVEVAAAPPEHLDFVTNIEIAITVDSVPVDAGLWQAAILGDPGDGTEEVIGWDEETGVWLELPTMPDKQYTAALFEITEDGAELRIAAPVWDGETAAKLRVTQTGTYAYATLDDATGDRLEPPTMTNLQQVTVPGEVLFVSLYEDSTAQVMGVCFFDEGEDVDVTGPSIVHDERIWCTRVYDAGSGTTTLEIRSYLNNLFGLRVAFKGGQPPIDAKADGIIRYPFDELVPDPYLYGGKFGGFKELTFSTIWGKHPDLVTYAWAPLKEDPSSTISLGNCKGGGHGMTCTIRVHGTMAAPLGLEGL